MHIVHASSGATIDTSTVITGQYIHLLTNDTVLTGTIYNGNSSTPAATGTSVNLILAAQTTSGTGTGPYLINVISTLTNANGQYSFNLASAPAGSYFLNIEQNNLDNYSNRRYGTPLGSISGSVTRSITLPTLSVSGSCTSSSSLCTVTVSGAGWLPSTSVEISAANSNANISFGGIVTNSSGQLVGSPQVSGAQVSGDYSVIGMQYGLSAEFIQVAVGPSIYRVSSVRAQSVATAVPTPTTSSASPTPPPAGLPNPTPTPRP